MGGPARASITKPEPIQLAPAAAAQPFSPSRWPPQQEGVVVHLLEGFGRGRTRYPCMDIAAPAHMTLQPHSYTNWTNLGAHPATCTHQGGAPRIQAPNQWRPTSCGRARIHRHLHHLYIVWNNAQLHHELLSDQKRRAHTTASIITQRWCILLVPGKTSSHVARAGRHPTRASAYAGPLPLLPTHELLTTAMARGAPGQR
jgi:hypothetical protein